MLTIGKLNVGGYKLCSIFITTVELLLHIIIIKVHTLFTLP